MAITILRRRQVTARTGLSRSSIYAKIAEGTFPKQIFLGARAVGWEEQKIEAWLFDCVERSRGRRDNE